MKRAPRVLRSGEAVRSSRYLDEAHRDREAKPDPLPGVRAGRTGSATSKMYGEVGFRDAAAESSDR